MAEKGQSCGPELDPEETKSPGKEGRERPHGELNGWGEQRGAQRWAGFLSARPPGSLLVP